MLSRLLRFRHSLVRLVRCQIVANDDSVELAVRTPIYIEELECRNDKLTLIELSPDFTFCGVMNTCA